MAGFSLSDQVTNQQPTNDDAKLTLNGLSIAFAELFEKLNNVSFSEACAASAQLGLFQPKLDYQTKSWLEQNRARASNVEDVSHNLALKRLCLGIMLAWEQREDELPNWITPGNKLTFSGLARLLRIS